ncbi:DUF932 domain-containing protein [Acinetobacter qingfengensis]|nr:DUF932 domain-containing protein [Acinetobacter qingfengensis]
MNHNETLIEIEDLMLNICSGKYHWKEVHFLLEDYLQLAHDIYDPETEYSPMLQGYFDLMSIHRSSRLVHRTKSNPRLQGQANNTGTVKVPHSTKFDAEAVKQQLGISVQAWDEHMYQMKQLSQRKVSQGEAVAYFDAVFNNSNMSILDQEENIIQFYRDVADKAKLDGSNTSPKSEPNGKAMSKVMQMFNGQGRGAELSSAKNTAYGLLCSMTEYIDHERRAMSRDHRLDSAWFGAGANLKQRSVQQALQFIA